VLELNSESTDAVLARHPDALSLLTDAERERHAAFRFPADAATFLAAHVLVRECVARVLRTGIGAVTIVQACDRCGSMAHGRPSVLEEPGLAVSFSHARGHVAAVAGPGPLGIDIEPVRSVAEPLFDHVLTPAEAALVRAAPDPRLAFLHFWVRKEALIKAGKATMGTMDRIDLAADDGSWDGLVITGWHDEQRGILGALARPRPT
jgi:4'-phosphopantetheinyl transferase